MRTLCAVAALTLLLAACGDAGTERAADAAGRTDPGTEPAEPAAPPTAVPSAPGPVRSRSIGTVMDTGDGPELCLGPIAESYPPQCSGPPVTGWDWAAQAPHVERQGGVRWGTFAVTGTWDGTTFAVTDAVPGALYDALAEEPPALPTPSRDLTRAELDALATDLGSSLPGAHGAYADQQGHVLVDVLYDDGTLQDHVDTAYGEGVVVVTSALVDV